MRRLALSAATLLALACLVACGGQEGADAPRIVLTPTALLFNSVPLGGQDRAEIRVDNEGVGELRVSNVEVETDTGFVILDPIAPTEFTLAPGDTLFLQLYYQPTAPVQTTGRVIFTTNDPQASTATVDLSTPTPQPSPAIIPPVLDFGIVGVNTTDEIPTSIRNVGLSPLIICELLVTGNPEIRSNLDSVLPARDEGDPIVEIVDIFDANTGVGINELEFVLTYTPLSPGPDAAKLVLHYDRFGDVGNPCADDNVERIEYDIVGEAGTALLAADPCPLDFGTRPMDIRTAETVTLRNNGPVQMELFDIRLDQSRTSPEFSLGTLPELPLSLAGTGIEGDSTVFEVEFRPTEETVYSGVYEVEHTDSSGARVTTECSMFGTGGTNDCAIADPVGWILQDAEGRRGREIDWALPLQTLVLDGTASYDPESNPIGGYIWEIVEAPDRAINGIRAFSGDPDNPALAEYFLPLAGRYQFCLSVVDDSGIECLDTQECVTVVAIPEEAIAIELTWDNPNDPDQADSEGSDVDLHFVKMPAPWFDPVYDAYYANETPIWNPENPSLDIDDTDGVGPETVQLDNPDDCQWYAVGVHYFREQWGTAWPTVRIFINGRVVDEIVNTPLFSTDDFWDVARIHWPTGTVERVNEITEGFDSSEGIAPRITDGMISSGLCSDF